MDSISILLLIVLIFGLFLMFNKKDNFGGGHGGGHGGGGGHHGGGGHWGGGRWRGRGPGTWGGYWWPYADYYNVYDYSNRDQCISSCVDKYKDKDSGKYQECINICSEVF